MVSKAAIPTQFEYTWFKQKDTRNTIHLRKKNIKGHKKVQNTVRSKSTK